MNEHLLPWMKTKKNIVDSSIAFLAEYYWKIINIFNKKLTNRLFSLQCDMTISSFCLNIVKKNLSETRAKNCLLSFKYGMENFIFTYSFHIWKFDIYPIIHICVKSRFGLKESLENMIFLWNRNLKKLTNIWSFLPFSEIFV